MENNNAYTNLVVKLADNLFKELKNNKPLIAKLVSPHVDKYLKNMTEIEAKGIILDAKDLLVTECNNIVA